MTILSCADRRTRIVIVQELMYRYWETQCSKCKPNISLQIALSYQTGYGQPCDREQCLIWLGRSGKSAYELEAQKNYAESLIVPPARSSRIRKLQDQFIFEVDHAHEYRMVHGIQFLPIKADCRRRLGILVSHLERRIP